MITISAMWNDECERLSSVHQDWGTNKIGEEADKFIEDYLYKFFKDQIGGEFRPQLSSAYKRFEKEVKK